MLGSTVPGCRKTQIKFINVEKCGVIHENAHSHTPLFVKVAKKHRTPPYICEYGIER